MCCGCLFSFCGIYVPNALLFNIPYTGIAMWMLPFGTVFSESELSIKQNGIVVYQDTESIVFNILSLH